MRKILLLILAVCFFAELKAQTSPTKLSGTYLGMTFERFTQRIESESEYKFHFKKSDIENVQVNLQAKDSDIRMILNQIFAETGLTYSIDSSNRIWVSKGRRIQIEFPKDYFLVQERQDNLAKAGDSLSAFDKNKRFVIGTSATNPQSKTAILSGIVSSIESGKAMSGAIVLEKVEYKQIATDQNGRYQLTLPKGRHTIWVQNIGGFQEQRQIDLKGDGVLNMSIEETILSLDEVVVSSGALSNVNKLDMGVQSITIAEVKRLPAVMGEVDVLKGILTMPGVNTVGEASSGFNVRGGAADQNLILYGNSTIFNPTHAFGFFSAFNADIVNGVELYKGSIPVNYGGRLSSVLQVDPKFGRSDKIGGSGGIGILTSRLSLDGPIGDKTNFIVGGRTTYSDWALNLLDEEADLNDSKVTFYDINANIQHTFNEKNSLELTAYLSQDDFQFDPDTTYSYQNINVALGWKHFFNDELEGRFTVGSDNYEFGIVGQDNPLNSFAFGFDVQQIFAKADFEYRKNEKHIMNFGIHGIKYTLNPGRNQPYGSESIVIDKVLDQENAREFSIYFGDEFVVSEKLSLSYGGRYMLYQLLGPATVNLYVPGAPITESNLIGEETYDMGKTVQTYQGPEVRISARYTLDNRSSVKAGFNTMRQNIHLLSNTSSISPTDSWKLSDAYIKPQTGGQASVGYYRNLAKNKLEFSTEVYYRYMANLLDYRSGANIILNESIEQDVLNSDGKAYGLELLLKKSTGSLKGSIAYTYSRSLMKTSDEPSIEKINNGAYYSSNFDQPHHLVLTANYELSKRVNTSLGVNYSTGRPITLPISKFDYAGSERVYFSDRNAYRIPDYFRVDFSVNIEGSHKIKKLAHSSWSLGVYNLLGRSNPYSVYYTPVEGQLRGYQLSIFAQPIPFITYNFRF
ncbi:outer membrane receptor protein involved in Fe transport [Algoriphagus ratkowskyi]|uniref:Outer membrane receptor protein involved in Fe transport n=1 Tax=Algoriphagus ratkowskyi TaxID=57028 RepID=A0A2W7QRT1_9BACT|nr:TonB-dependent receptor [Algoriphagus ratkowskyi]PZX50691.1 outer membrane receptor protein involved in Fe transport [Algoriphagus ratkowskyi]TXD75817.1 TonB-dependent receptor [Algoriphagus ratkowskyi]